MTPSYLRRLRKRFLTSCVTLWVVKPHHVTPLFLISFSQRIKKWDSNFQALIDLRYLDRVCNCTNQLLWKAPKISWRQILRKWDLESSISYVYSPVSFPLWGIVRLCSKSSRIWINLERKFKSTDKLKNG